MSEPRRHDDYPLRARKRARTRVALVEALVARLVEQSLDEVSVGDLCDEVGISQATFFNYFPTKADLLTHFVQLWSLEVGLLARRVDAETADPLAAIDAIFAATAKETAEHPGVMLEILAHQARVDNTMSVAPVERVERLLWLEDADGVDALPDDGLGTLVPAWLGRAVAQGLLSPTTDVLALTVSVVSLFFGVPLLVARSQPDAIAPLYAQGLALLWAGARRG